MFITAQQIHQAMAAIVEEPDYPLLQAYKKDFYEYDLEILKRDWSAQARAIWVVTPNGTHLNFVGHHERQALEVDASINSGYEHIEIYLLKATKIERITKMRAMDEAKKLDFKIKGNCEITDALGNTVAYMTVEQLGNICQRTTKVSFEPGLAFTGTPSQLAALRNIAINESIRVAQTLFVGVQRITVGESLLASSGLVHVPAHPDDKTKSVFFSPAEFKQTGKGFYSKRRNWGHLKTATLIQTPAHRIPVPEGAQLITLREARLLVAEHEGCIV